MNTDSNVRPVSFLGITTQVLRPSNAPISTTTEKPVTLAKGVKQTGKKPG